MVLPDIKAPEAIDYEKEGLIVGLEFHQQVQAAYDDEASNVTHGSKLFCSCPALIRDDDPDFNVNRRLRPVSGETGELDIATIFEQMKETEIIYEGYRDTTCLVELDEEPILPINKEALFRTLAMSHKIFGLKLVDEILVSRKAIIDGSNTSGFQRTAMIAYGTENSYIDVDGKRISIYQANLEEDSAKNVGKSGSARRFRLDRLGIPLIEIATGPDIRSPEGALKTASRIGELLRTTGFVKRGQGTIRQDLNVSISAGTRIEIKGVSDLELVPLYVRNEAIRQSRMLAIVSELKSRNLTRKKIDNIRPVDLTSVFRKTKAKLISRALKKKQKVTACKLPSFKGLLKFELQSDYRLGTELSEICKVTGGVGGLLHSDELPKFNISQEEIDSVDNKLKVKPKADAFILIIGDEGNARRAIAGLKNTIKLWLSADTLLAEVRAPRNDGTTGYLRPLPGQARMYPETDSRPLTIDNEMKARIKKIKFELPEERENRYIKKMKLSKELASQMVLHPQNQLFEQIVEQYKVSATLVASTLVSTIIDLRRQGIETDKISDANFHEIFRSISKHGLMANAIEPVLIEFSKSNLPIPIGEIISKLGLEKLDNSKVEAVIDKYIVEHADLVKERGMGAMGTLMRVVMEELTGKADGKLVSNLVRTKIQEFSK